ncbi:MAG: methylated-DNA--[protein]-cysteine S-methyltransferase [Spongiibacteraceae bacterium]
MPKANETEATTRHRETIANICRLIESSEQTLALDQLAEQAGMSRFHFQRIFKKIVGITPKQFQQGLRLARTQRALRAEVNVTDAIYAAGFNSSGHFYTDADKLLGMQAQQYRSGGKGVAIRYGSAPCTLGVLLIAATDKGICSIEIGDGAQALIEALRAHFPHAQLLPMDAQIEHWLRELVQFIEQPNGVLQQSALQLPLDIQGTAFQRQVWQALRDIPLGSTASYADIAARIGKPKAVRAVATACASNKLALAIPCHRVIRGSGELAGYRWGVERKRALLQRESAAKTTPDSERSTREPTQS